LQKKQILENIYEIFEYFLTLEFMEVKDYKLVSKVSGQKTTEGKSKGLT